MSRIIILSDVHGNLEALRAVWAEIQQRPYDALYFLGDAAAFGPSPSACVAMLRDEIRPTASIAGNTDRYLVEKTWEAAPDHPIQQALRWTNEQLTDADCSWLAALPATFETTAHDVAIQLVHGAPTDDEVGLGTETPAATMASQFLNATAGVTFCGHTHLPWRGKVGARQIFNVGSVGFPFDGDQRPGYVRLTVRQGRIHDVEFRRVSANMDGVARALVASGMPAAAEFSWRLRHARSRPIETPDA